MNANLNIKVAAIFNECGLKLVENSELMHGIDVPNEGYVVASYDESTDETKMKLINDYIWDRNHFQISDWKLFFPSSNFNKFEEESIKYILELVRIIYRNEAFNYMFPGLTYKHLKLLLKNKNFIKLFSNEIQLKAIFLTNPQLQVELRKEIIKSIIDKVNDLGIKEKMHIELPKLVLDSFSE